MSIQEILRYVNVTFWVTLLLFVPLMGIRRYITKGKLKNNSLKHELANMLFIFYILALYEITAFRFGGIGWNIENMLERRTRVNSEPLSIVWQWTVQGIWWHLFYNVIGNCVWFIPLGLLMPAIYREFRGKPIWVMFIGMAISSSIEVLQFLLCTGVTDIDDVIFNTLGAGMGYFCWYLFDKIRHKLNRR